MKIWKVVTDVLLVALIALAAVLVLPRVLGLKPMIVLSGSMEPTYHVGSLIYVGKADPGEVKEGDAITFDLDGKGTLVTHRVIEVDKENQCFYTQGDANKDPDGSPVAYGNVVGKPKFTIPKMGYLAAYLNTRQGMIIMVTVIAAVLILVFMTDLIAKAGKESGGEENGKE